MPVKRFLKENNYKLYVINPIYSKMYKQNLRKTKTDKEDCLKLAELFFIKDFKKYIEQEQFYLNLNAISRKYNTLIEAQTRLKNEFRMESMKYLLSMKNCLKEVLYSLILL